MKTDQEITELAARAAGITGIWARHHQAYGNEWVEGIYRQGDRFFWAPLTNDGDRYRLARQLKIGIDFVECCAWYRYPNGDLLQEFWGGDCPDEAHTIVLIAAQMGERTP